MSTAEAGGEVNAASYPISFFGSKCGVIAIVKAARSYVVGMLLWTFADLKTGQSVMRAGGLN